MDHKSNLSRHSNYAILIRNIIAMLALFTFLAPNTTAQDLDRPPASNEVDYSPADGDLSSTNPPPFIWLPAEGQDLYLLQYSRSASFSPSTTVTVRDIDMTVHIPTGVLRPGTWYWRFGYNDGGTDRFSITRKFEIPKSAVHFPLVTADEFIERIPRERPRLYFSPALVQEIRTDAEGRYKGFTGPVIEQAENILAMNEPLFREPDPWPEDFRAIYNNAWITMRPYTRRMVTSALAYLYSGNVRYAEEAKRRLMHFMSWDVKGPSSTIWPTELGMDIAANATPVFDWIYDVLSDEERRICTEVLTARMVQINHDVHRAMPMESRPFSSHPGRMVGFALEGGIVLAHEVPEAREWIDYTLKLVWSTYPAWGGDEGGWHEGIHYWSAYMQMILRVVHELDHYGIPLKDKPFFRNTGYFGLYAAYPDRPTAAFGDGHHIPLRAATGTVTYLLSNLYNNPWFRWHSEQIGSGPSGREAVRAYNPGLQSRSPDELPQSRVFYDVGLVAMHSRMSDPDNNVMMLFKSNPFGAISHNHASQNAFVIEAFKEPLTISSGYRQTHGTPHHREWIWETKAHNSILVDNEGQMPRQRSSKGEIIAYQEHDSYVYTAGDATAAYGGRLDRFHRHVLFVRPGYFVIIDDLKTRGSSSTYQWLFHAKNQMEVDDQNNIVVSTSGDARLALRFLTPGKLEFSQHTGFDPPVENPATAPDQFHLMASTIDPSPGQRFVTVMWVDRDGAMQSGQGRQGSGSPSAPAAGEGDGGSLIRKIGNSGVDDSGLLNRVMQDTQLLEATGGMALRVGDDLVLWKEPGERRVSAAGTSSRKDMEVKAGFFR